VTGAKSVKSRRKKIRGTQTHRRIASHSFLGKIQAPREVLSAKTSAEDKQEKGLYGQGKKG